MDQDSLFSSDIGPPPPDDNLCSLCQGISVETLTSFNGHRHARSNADLKESARRCKLCYILHERPRFGGGDGPYILKLLRKEENVGGSSDLRVLIGGQHSTMPLDLFTNADDPAMKYGVKIKRSLSTTSSDESFTVARSWIHECTRHSNCVPALRLSGRSDPGCIPTRLIDLSHFEPASADAKLIIVAHPCPDYITLSYCWGSAVHHRYITTQANLNLRCDRIKYDELPQTFKDAFTVARRLGVMYIWIDAICIIQDSLTDWETESSKMGFIYENSALTITAEHSKDIEGGCFNTASESLDQAFSNRFTQVSAKLRNGDKSCLYVWDTYGAKYEKRKFRNYFEVNSGVLSTRGWACQERILSPRILHYTTKQMYWKCRTSLVSEDNLSLVDPSTSAVSVLSSILITNDPYVKTTKHTLEAWYNGIIAASYSKRNLTVYGDKLPAISGLARRIYEEFKVLQLQPVYLAGLWSENIGYGLSWSRETRLNDPESHGLVANPDVYRSPSFSWAAFDGAVRWPSDTFESPVKLLDSHITLRGQDQYGSVAAGWIKVAGRVLKAILRETEYSNSDNEVEIVTCHDGSFIGLGTSDGDPAQGDVHCLELWTKQERGKSTEHEVLFIQPVNDDHEEFCRVGMGTFYVAEDSELDWTDQVVKII